MLQLLNAIHLQSILLDALGEPLPCAPEDLRFNSMGSNDLLAADLGAL